MEDWDQSAKNQLEKQTQFDNSNPQPNAAAAASVGNDGTVTPNVAPNASVNLNPNLNPAVSAADFPAVLAALGLSAGLLESVQALNRQYEQLVGPLASIPRTERRRYRYQANGDTGHTDSLKGLIAQRPDAVPPDASLANVSALESVRDLLAPEVERVRTILVRLEDVATLASRQFQARLSTARIGLQSASRYAGADLGEQLARAGTRFHRKRKKPAAPGATGAPATEATPPPPAGPAAKA